jgi:SulP family sulfate permease
MDFGTPIADGGLGGAIVGSIPEGLPSLTIPNFDFSVINQMIVTAVTIGLIGFMEAISIAKAMAAQTKQRLNADQELMGQGLANVVSSLFQGYAVSGSFSRSAVNISAGAVTGFSSVVTAVIVGITLLWLTPLLYHLPQATLAAVIIMAVINLIKFAPIMHAWKVEKHDAVVAVTSFVLTLLFAPHLENGIVIGVILSLVLFLYRTMEPRFTELSAHDGSSLLVNALDNKLDRCEVVSIVKYSGSLYFANAGYFEDKILKLIADKHECLKYIIVDMAGINQIDASGEDVLSGLLDRCSAGGVEILFARTEGIESVLKRSGFIDRFGEDRFYERRTDALRFAWKELGDEEAASKSPLKHLIS